MKKALMLASGLAMTVTLIAFPAASFAHKGEPENSAKAIAKAMKHPLVVRGGKVANLTIVHVTRGCHVWSRGKTTARGAKVFIASGGEVGIRNQDIDMHKLVRLAGPKTALGGFIRMNQVRTVRFTKRGVYRLRTKTAEMPGMVDVKTIGPDNPLPIVVVVR